MKLAILNLHQALKKKREFDSVITIEDPFSRPKLRFHKNPKPPHLILSFEDVENNKALNAPTLEHIKQTLDFIKVNSPKNLLIHCYAGISRSTALAYIILANEFGVGEEAKAYQTPY